MNYVYKNMYFCIIAYKFLQKSKVAFILGKVDASDG